MTPTEKQILTEILDADGLCLSGERCRACPFRQSCLPEFLCAPHTRPSKEKRVAMALDAITNIDLLEDETQWRKNPK